MSDRWNSDRPLPALEIAPRIATLMGCTSNQMKLSPPLVCRRIFYGAKAHGVPCLAEAYELIFQAICACRALQVLSM